MPILTDDIRGQLKQIFDSSLKNKVKLVYIYREFDCQYCNEISELLTEVRDIKPELIELKKINFELEREEAEKYNPARIPATFIMDEAEEVRGIVYYGIPSGYEFSSLIEDITMVSTGHVDIQPDVAEKIKSIDVPMNIKVFVTPTCPYCPRAVRVAHKFAYINRNIVGEMIEAIEFPELSDRFMVHAVPKIVINDGVVEFEGALPENMFAEYVMQAYEAIRDKKEA